MRSISAFISLIDVAAVAMIRSKLPLTEWSVRTSGIRRKLPATEADSFGRKVTIT